MEVAGKSLGVFVWEGEGQNLFQVEIKMFAHNHTAQSPFNTVQDFNQGSR